MTNEQLVKKIQSGKAEYMPLLWDQIQSYIYWKAKRYLSSYPEHYMQYIDDCVNTGYFAVESAVKTYNRQYGKFVTYLKMPLVNCFREAIYYGRSEKQINDIANTAASLDETIELNGKQLPLHEMAADKLPGVQTCYAQSRQIEAIESQDQTRSIHDLLSDALKKDESAGGKILLYMLDNDCRYIEAVNALYGNDTNSYRWQKKAAMSRLRRYIVSKPDETKKHGIDEIITASGLRQYGLQPYKDHIFTSAVERAVIKRVDKQLN